MKNKVFIFKIFVDEEIYRVIEIKGTSSLIDFAEIIVESFHFDMNHAFGFYSNINNLYKSDEVYELFADEDSYEKEDHVKGVKKTAIESVFTKGKEMIFLFDYGDEWNFLVRCEDLVDVVSGAKYPTITKTVGESPDQYEPEENEDDEYDEDYKE
jgi:hypothetical protein